MSVLITGGTGFLGRQIVERLLADGRHVTVLARTPAPDLEKRGVRSIVVRLPQVHDTVKQGLVTYSIQLAREKGISAYIGDGLNRWPAAHRLDTARLYRLALEKADAGDRFHAVAEEGVPVRDIAEAIGRGLKLGFLERPHGSDSGAAQTPYFARQASPVTVLPAGRYSTQMLSFGWMKPADAAALFSYLRSNFVNSAAPVDAATVAQALGQ